MSKKLPMNYYYFALTEAVIGFEETFYSFSEDDGSAIVHVTLLSGALTNDVVVTVVTEDDEAVGKPLTHSHCIFPHIYMSNMSLCTWDVCRIIQKNETPYETSLLS